MLVEWYTSSKIRVSIAIPFDSNVLRGCEFVVVNVSMYLWWTDSIMAIYKRKHYLHIKLTSKIIGDGDTILEFVRYGYKGEESHNFCSSSFSFAFLFSSWKFNFICSTYVRALNRYGYSEFKAILSLDFQQITVQSTNYWRCAKV